MPVEGGEDWVTLRTVDALAREIARATEILRDELALLEAELRDPKTQPLTEAIRNRLSEIIGRQRSLQTALWALLAERGIPHAP